MSKKEMDILTYCITKKSLEYVLLYGYHLGHK